MSTTVPPSAALQADSSDVSESVEPPLARVILAWGVHLFTASGAVVGTVALLAIANDDLALAGLLMLVTLGIDSIDGTLARAVGVGAVLPRVDGRRLDDMVDYLNFVIVPVVFMVAAGSLLWWGLAALPILASAYGFCQEDAKTEDGFFLGFPSYWNVLALYLWLLGLSPLAGTLWLVGLSIAVFIPLKYVYPNKLTVLRRTTTASGVVWSLALAAAILWTEATSPLRLVEVSLLYPAYYIVLSLCLGGLQRSKG